jgi:two-component system, cell cycle sensor histidine kinase and response regulator CckA
LLVVDDNPAIHEDFKKILQPARPSNGSLAAAKKSLFGRDDGRAICAEFRVDSALQGQEALEKVKQALAATTPYALAFVDLRMPPGWDGIQTIRHLWEADADLQVVICTAYSDYSWDDIFKQLGPSDSLVILKKPFDHVEVLQLAHALTKKWFLTQQTRRQMQNLEDVINQRTAELRAANDVLKTQIRERTQAEERFTKAFRASPMPLAIRTLDQERYVDVNESFLRMTGFGWDEVVGHSASELGLWGQSGQESKILRALREQKRLNIEECEIRTRSGSQRSVLLSAELFELGDEPHVLVILQDITDRINLESQLRQSQKMDAVGQLAAGVAHDFNNLLTVINGYSGLCLARPGLNPEVAHAIEHVKAASERAAALTRQLLVFSRKQLLQRKPLLFNEVIGRMHDMVQRLIGETIALECDLAPTLPLVMGDEANLGQVVLNLAVNARDAMPNGGRLQITTRLVELHPSMVRSKPDARPGHFICLSVADTGVGMDTQVLNRLFEPFYTTKPVGKGTGLGLSTVYGIVKQHEGWVEVSSRLGSGSSFQVYLPVMVPAADEPVKAETAEQVLPPLPGHETILVVEDEPAVREMVCVTLSSHGYQVVQAGDGHEAFALWRSSNHNIDVLLTDIVMPNGLSGIQLAERISKESKGLKVVFTSGYSAEMLEDSSLNAGGINFLPKPYDPSKLLKVVHAALERPGGEHAPRQLSQMKPRQR